MMRGALLVRATIVVCALFAQRADPASFIGRYCEIEGAETESGEAVTGECYMYSEQYGDLDGASTASGEAVAGECYRYSDAYAELDGAETEGGESVSGECYFY